MITSDKQEELAKQKRKREQEQIEILLNTISNVLLRQKKIKDPTTRYILLVDKLSLSLDIFISVLQFQSTDWDDKTKKRSETLIKDLQKELNGLLEYMQEPHYSPDHSYGQKMMKEAETDFESKVA